MSISVAAVNDPPVYTIGANVTVIEDFGPFTATGWATGIGPGAANETGQVLAFQLTTNNPTLFSTAPAVSPTGTLTFQTAPNANGTATVNICACR
ncbi:MAG: hypothetical protein QM757_44045 [Paludibaculum sp.]